MLRRVPAAGARSAERGASAVEYVALIVVAALLVGGVVVALGKARAAERTRAAVCTIVRDPACAREAGSAPERPGAGTPRDDAPREDDGCHGFVNCLASAASGVGGGVAGAAKDSLAGLKTLVTTNPVTTGKGLVSYLWSKSGGAAFTAVESCTSGRWRTCGESTACVISGPTCLVQDMVVDEETKDDLVHHRWADASGRVLWNGGTLLVPAKIPGLNKIGKLAKSGRRGHSPVARGPREFEAAEKELDDIRRDGGPSDMFQLDGVELARRFADLDAAERTRLLDSMTREELAAFYDAAPGFGGSVRSDILEAASPRALERMDPPDPRFADSGGWRTFDGDLWGGMPRAGDVAQGPVGDCFCLAPSASVADLPRGSLELEDMIKKNPNGTYTVTFGDGKRVTVTNRIPVNGAHVTDRAGWPAILEKAMAERAGGYDVLNKGGKAADTLYWLTGRKVDEYKGAYDMPRLSEIHGWLNRGQDPMTVTFSKDLRLEGATRRGIIRHHVYSVQSIDRYRGVITLANPHGPSSQTVTLSEAELRGTPGIFLTRGHLPERRAAPDDDFVPYWED